VDYRFLPVICSFINEIADFDGGIVVRLFT